MLEKVAGKRQGQIVGAVIGNFEAVEKALGDMEQSLNSADAELAVVQDTAAYAIQKVKNELTAIAQNNITQDFLKDIIGDVGRLLEVFERSEATLRPLFSVIEGITSLVASFSEKLGALGTVIAALSFKGAVTGTGRDKMFSLIEYARCNVVVTLNELCA